MRERLAAAAMFLLALALYASTMATSFTAGDSAVYLNLAHSGQLTVRGNGLPLYVTLLNFCAWLPIPFDDGVRCNFLGVLMGAGAVLLTFLACQVWTRRLAASVAGALSVLLSGMIWTNTSWIMPHVSMAAISAGFLLLLGIDRQSPSGLAAAGLGLICGIGYGLLPNALLLLPFALAQSIFGGGTQRRNRRIERVILGFAAGLALNALLILLHEFVAPSGIAPDASLLARCFLFLRGGAQAGWMAESAAAGAATSRLALLPLELLADFEIWATALALFGVSFALRSQWRERLGLLGLLATFTLWVGLYPGDTRLLHGLGAYPVAALLTALGSARLLELAEEPINAMPRWVAPMLLVTAIPASMGVAGLSYRPALCGAGVGAYCHERVPERRGDEFLRRTELAVARMPEGALALGTLWDRSAQLEYLLEIRGQRPDLSGPRSLANLDASEFETVVLDFLAAGGRAYVYGDGEDLRRHSAEHLRRLESLRRGPELHELRLADGDAQ